MNQILLTQQIKYLLRIYPSIRKTVVKMKVLHVSFQTYVIVLNKYSKLFMKRVEC